MNNRAIDTEVLRRYDKTGPHYKFYPAAVRFSDDFQESDYRQVAIASINTPERALSLYYYIPFCTTLCFYCACNKFVTKNPDRAKECLTKKLLYRGSCTNIIN
ncbi:MAG: hypothetical protein OEQ39_04310 [Gammaproteobacteria bacterium]|nr:hypothetical protein [Gammaproteobacteria bacterium]